MPIQGCRNDCQRNLSQLFFASPHEDHCTAVRLPAKCSPAQIGFDAETAFEKHIDSDKQLFFENGKPLDAIYFRRYASCLINENCGAFAEGVLVLTSMQDEAFADDVLDTLAFLSTIVASYLFAYRRCFQKHNVPDFSAQTLIARTPSGFQPKQSAITPLAGFGHDVPAADAK